MYKNIYHDFDSKGVIFRIEIKAKEDDKYFDDKYDIARQGKDFNGKINLFTMAFYPSNYKWGYVELEMPEPDSIPPEKAQLVQFYDGDETLRGWTNTFYNQKTIITTVKTTGRGDDEYKPNGRVLMHISRDAKMPLRTRQELAYKYSPVFKFVEQCDNSIWDDLKSWVEDDRFQENEEINDEEDIDVNSIVDVLENLIIIDDSIRPMSIDDYFSETGSDGRAELRKKTLGGLDNKQIKSNPTRSDLKTYSSTKYYLDIQNLGNYQDILIILNAVLAILTCGSSLTSNANIKQVIETVKKIVEYTKDKIDDAKEDSTGQHVILDAYQNVFNDEKSRWIYANVIPHDDQSDGNYITIQYWLFFPYDSGDPIISALMEELLGLSPEREGDWEMVQVTLKNGGSNNDWEISEFKPIETSTGPSSKHPAIMTFGSTWGDKGFSETNLPNLTYNHQWTNWDELSGESEDNEMVEFSENEKVYSSSGETRHPVIWINGRTHETRLKRPFTIPTVFDYTEKWQVGYLPDTSYSYNDGGIINSYNFAFWNNGEKTYHIEVMDEWEPSMNDFLKFEGLWGHDYLLSPWGNGPNGPMYESNYWGTPWTPWGNELNNEGQVYHVQ